MAPNRPARTNVLITVPIDGLLVDRIRAVNPTITVRSFHLDPADRPVFPSDLESRALPNDVRPWMEDVEILFGYCGKSLQRAIAGDQPFRRAVPSLRWIQLTATGADHVDAQALSGVRITTIGGALSPVIAEYAVAGVLALLKRLPEAIRAQDARVWSRYQSDDLAGKTVCTVGYGRIGSAVASLMRAFGCRIVAVRRHVEAPATPRPDAVLPRERLREALAEADVVVVAVPLSPATATLIGPAELACLKPSAILVNVARGAIVDEEALIEALRTRRIGGAVLDTFQKEPLPAAHPLWNQTNAIITPHVAAGSARYDAIAVECFIDNLRRYLQGQALRHEASTAAR